jgi:hypothetical protein
MTILSRSTPAKTSHIPDMANLKVPAFTVNASLSPSSKSNSPNHLLAVQRLKHQIMVDEDERIFAAMDLMVKRCNDKSHEAFGKDISYCSDPECVVKTVLDE